MTNGTGFETPSLTFKVSKVIEASKRFRRGCKPLPALNEMISKIVYINAKIAALIILNKTSTL